MKYNDIVKNSEILAYYEKGNAILEELGYTDHSVAHTMLVAEKAAEVLRAFGYSEIETELARIAGFMHDIGNAVNRNHHAEYGAILANEILKETDMSIQDRVLVVSAIANHDESTGVASDPVTAAVIIADKTDVRRTRVRQKDPILFDIHDRVNYAVTNNRLEYDTANKKIILHLTIDENTCTMYDYFDIFLGRMTMCSRAARVLGTNFSLKVNGQKVL
ncbi:MAG: HD domain-containing protein [Spirochaetaceae bacterium]|nr:HD domain-containing protein [Spirochaetaceae bacterium]